MLKIKLIITNNRYFNIKTHIMELNIFRNRFGYVLLVISMLRVIYRTFDVELEKILYDLLFHDRDQNNIYSITVLLIRNVIVSITIYIISMTICNIVLYIENYKTRKQQEICIICLEEYNRYIFEPKTKLLCGHKYHKRCIDRWLLQNPSCPYCRFNIN